MEYTAKYITPDIKLSSYDDKFFKSDIAFDQHMLIWFISGETKIVQAGEVRVFGKNDIFLIPRNQLATIINYPKDGMPHKTVVMHLSASFLQDFYSTVKITEGSIPSPRIIRFNPNPLLTGCLASLFPYFEMESLPDNLALLKMREAVTILRSIDPAIDATLANFDLPGKVELTSFMEKNFMFNMPLERFGYLTGRSLTTFKRDFRKAYGTTPQRWLTEKRLQLAHYHFVGKQQNPIDVCYEVGFENLSHFSFAFKKQFGYSPRQLLATMQKA
jgi:AraC family transcriptional regulator, exoenzyme S synthesis regulatory protein ExsA